MRRTRLALVPSIAVAAVLLAGCSADAAPAEEAEEPTASASASDSAAVEAACEDITPADDAVIPGVGVTDEAGTYCTVAPDPATTAFDPSMVDTASLDTYGFTMEEAEAAYDAANSFFITATLDSTRLDVDSPSNEAWLDEHADLLFNPSVYEPSEGLPANGLAVSDIFSSPLVRDGNPRISSLRYTTPATVYATDIEGVLVLVVTQPADIIYRATDEQVVEIYLTENPESTVEELETSAPQLFDGDDQGLTLSGGLTSTHRKDDPSLLSGTRFQFTFMVGDFMVSAQ